MEEEEEDGLKAKILYLDLKKRDDTYEECQLGLFALT